MGEEEAHGDIPGQPVVQQGDILFKGFICVEYQT